ncbi:hypothetical protein GCM10009545_14920 [Saccharopolyspora thermophila]|uniref:Protein kinase domain-containing protein n=1 Tax=Saccharopolyspora thermophila TaxID=89367 RepID=A0ABP3M5P1_9PSEU
MPIPEHTSRAPYVYVFRAHQSEEHVELVRDFATMLRVEAGIEADVKEWRAAQRTDEVADEIARFRDADFVLVVASPDMRRLMDSSEQGPIGDTTHVGAALARNRLAGNLREELRRMLPVVLPDATPEHIPRMLRSYATNFYQIKEFDIDSDGVQDLLHVLLETPRHARPPRGMPYQVVPGSWDPPVGHVGADADVLLRSGATVVLGQSTYLVCGEVEEPSQERGPAILRQARALLLGDPNEQVWLRQVERRADARSAGEACAALEKEHELLGTIGPEHDALPRSLALVDTDRTRTLVLGWPRSTTPPDGFETLADYIPRPTELDSTAVRRTLQALSGLCRPLEALHRHHCTHRELAPHTIVRIDEDHLALRDLGAAGRPARPGIDRSGYQAPEQTHHGRAKIGPWTDVFRLAAVAYHMISGRLPDEPAPLPTSAVCPFVPERAAAAIDAALHPDITQRPTVAELAAALRM